MDIKKSLRNAAHWLADRTFSSGDVMDQSGDIPDTNHAVKYLTNPGTKLCVLGSFTGATFGAIMYGTDIKDALYIVAPIMPAASALGYSTHRLLERSTALAQYYVTKEPSKKPPSAQIVAENMKRLQENRVLLMQTTVGTAVAMAAAGGIVGFATAGPAILGTVIGVFGSNAYRANQILTGRWSTQEGKPEPKPVRQKKPVHARRAQITAP